jgi:3-hydroxyacyl-[acyl-carrier-protein] dehydratase
MEFTLLDKITKIKPGASISATKHLPEEEEYLGDHFPGYPVMPGVMMLECLVQTGAWLLRVTNDFSDSMILLKEARNVKYAKFLKPGETLTIEVKILDDQRPQYKLQGTGSVNGQVILTARFVLKCFNLAEVDKRLGENDRTIIQELRKKYGELSGTGKAGKRAPLSEAEKD